jgi:hypothetical protein
MDYPSIICEYCPYTDYGAVPVGTGPHNLCEGRFCEEALEEYNNHVADEDQFASIEEAF